MDRRIEANLESYLRGTLDEQQRVEFEQALARGDEQTRRVVRKMELHSRLIRETLKIDEDLSPGPAFYARVLDRISQRPVSIWFSLIEPVFFRRLAWASAMLLLLVGVTVFTAEPPRQIVAQDLVDFTPDQVMASESEPLDVTTVSSESGRNRVLVDLTTYQE